MQVTDTHMEKPRLFRWVMPADEIPAFVREPHVWSTNSVRAGKPVTHSRFAKLEHALFDPEYIRVRGVFNVGEPQ